MAYKTTMSGNAVALFENAALTWFAKTLVLTKVFAQLKVKTSRSSVDGAMSWEFAEPLTRHSLSSPKLLVLALALALAMELEEGAGSSTASEVDDAIGVRCRANLLAALVGLLLST